MNLIPLPQWRATMLMVTSVLMTLTIVVQREQSVGTLSQHDSDFDHAQHAGNAANEDAASRTEFAL
jgi:hypothetical protein